MNLYKFVSRFLGYRIVSIFKAKNDEAAQSEYINKLNEGDIQIAYEGFVGSHVRPLTTYEELDDNAQSKPDSN